MGAGTVSHDLAFLHPVALVHERLLVIRGALVRAFEFAQHVGVAHPVITHDGDVVGAHGFDHTGLLADNQVTRIVGGTQLHAGAHQRRLGTHQRHGLTLHVRTHEGTVRVVVLQERNHGGSDGHHLPRRHVHVVDVFAIHHLDVALFQAHGHAVFGNDPVLVKLGIGLGHHIAVFLIGGEVIHLIRDHAVNHLSVWGFDKAEGIHPGIRRQGTDQPNVRAFGGFDRAHAPIVRGVHVTHLNAGAFTGQTTRAQGGQAPLVGQAGQGVIEVHELRQLGAAEEFPNGGGHRPHVNQGGRSNGLRILGGHALAHDPFHAGQAHPNLVLDQLAHGTQPTVTKVVNVVGFHGYDFAGG